MITRLENSIISVGGSSNRYFYAKKLHLNQKYPKVLIKTKTTKERFKCKFTIAIII